MNKQNIIIGITIGDINGIGIEVILKALADNRILDNITPIVYGSAKIINYYKKGLNISGLYFNPISKVSSAIKHKCNVVNIINSDIIINQGTSSSISGELAFKSLKTATNDLASGHIDVLITAPINKKNIQSADFNFPGHTEFLTKLSNEDTSLMLMCFDNLKIGVATNHISVSKISNSINEDLLLKKIKTIQII